MILGPLHPHPRDTYVLTIQALARPALARSSLSIFLSLFLDREYTQSNHNLVFIWSTFLKIVIFNNDSGSPAFDNNLHSKRVTASHVSLPLAIRGSRIVRLLPCCFLFSTFFFSSTVLLRSNFKFYLKKKKSFCMRSFRIYFFYQILYRQTDVAILILLCASTFLLQRKHQEMASPSLALKYRLAS